MIKRISYIVLIIISILFTVGYFRYNPTVNLINTIPVYADVVVRVNLREIEYNMMKDAVKHPFFYFESTKSSGNTKNRLSLFDEVVIPADIFFYTNYSNLKNTWVSSVIEIKDKASLRSFFKQEKLIGKREGNIEYFTDKNKLYFISNDELRVLFSFGEITKIKEKINFVINNKAYLIEEDNVLCKLKNSNELIVISTKKEDFFELGIDDESLLLKGKLSKNNNLFLPYKVIEKRNSLVSISGNINSNLLFGLIEKQQKNKFKNLTNLSLDSIHNHWNGNFDIELKFFRTINDTVVTYEYDDDFNKVEKTTIQKNITPDINIKLGGTTLFDYLDSKDAIKSVDGENLLVINPFFKTYAGESENNVILFSKNINAVSSKKGKKNKFLLFFNVEKYMKIEKSTYSISNKYLSSVKNIKAFVTKENAIQVKINLKNSPQKNALQLLK